MSRETAVKHTDKAAVRWLIVSASTGVLCATALGTGCYSRSGSESLPDVRAESDAIDIRVNDETGDTNGGDDINDGDDADDVRDRDDARESDANDVIETDADSGPNDADPADAAAGSDPIDADTSTECPTAIAGCRVGTRGDFVSELAAISLQELQCDATMSVGIDAPITEYQWTVVDRPDGSTSLFSPGPNTPNPSFFIDLGGQYTFRLNVIDERGTTSCKPAEVIVVTGAPASIGVQLTWHTPNDNDETDTSGTDLDLHFMRSVGGVADLVEDVHYRNPNPNWGGGAADPSLDINDTDGAGPENVVLGEPEADTYYRVGVHYADDRGLGSSIATIRIDAYGLLVFEASRELANTDDYWDVAAIHWDSVEVISIDQVVPVCVASNGQFPAGCP